RAGRTGALEPAFHRGVDGVRLAHLASIVGNVGGVLGAGFEVERVDRIRWRARAFALHSQLRLGLARGEDRLVGHTGGFADTVHALLHHAGGFDRGVEAFL